MVDVALEVGGAAVAEEDLCLGLLVRLVDEGFG